MENNIKKIRFDRDMSQAELAKKAGISRTTLSMIENSQCVPDGNTIAKLVSALKLPAGDIFFALSVK